ncbi:WGR domain-containing protein [Shigella flexneri]
MRHFIYQDEKSHKFWQSSNRETSCISVGKSCTKGQSQIKSFSDAAAAAKSGAQADCGEGEEGGMWRSGS